MIQFPLNLAPNAVQPVAAYGSYVYYESGSAGLADSSINVKVQGGSAVDYILKVGQGFRVPDNYTGLIVSNAKSEGTIVGSLVFAEEGFFDNRVVGTVGVSGQVSIQGNVTTIDSGRDRTLASRSFLGGASVALDAAINPNQLWNPVGSGKNLVLRNIQAQVNDQTNSTIYMTTTAVATLAAAPVSKLLGGAGGVGQIRTDSGASLPAGSIKIASLILPTINITQVPLIDPIVIRPGYGLFLTASKAGATLSTIFDFYEE